MGVDLDWRGVDHDAYVHPLAFVDGAVIGAGTRVWQFASVIRGTVLGEGCNVASGALLDGPRFGDRCIISQGVAIGPGFWIGDDVFIGPNVTFCNDCWPSYDKDGFDADALRCGLITIRVHDGASIGANAVILPGVTIGRKSVIAAGAAVDRDVPDDHLWSRQGLVKIKPEWRTRRMRRANS